MSTGDVSILSEWFLRSCSKIISPFRGDILLCLDVCIQEGFISHQFIDTTFSCRYYITQYGLNYLTSQYSLLPIPEPQPIPEPLPEHVIDMIKTFVEVKKYMCPITQTIIEPDNIHVTECGHIFDVSALFEWYSSKTTCPICRKEIYMNDHTSSREDADRWARDHGFSEVSEGVIEGWLSFNTTQTNPGTS